MKIQCDVCEKAEGEVLCCADEAVLCKGCDAKVHTANKLSQKHQRLFLLKAYPPSGTSSSPSSSQLPLCDTCQESKGYVFCLEDRAVLCSQCDISTHAENPYVLFHQRFIISDVKIPLQSSTKNNDIGTSSSSSINHPSCLAVSMGSSFDFVPDKESMASLTMELEAASIETNATFPSEPYFATQPHWPLDDIYDTNNFNFHEFSEVGSSTINSQ